MTPPDPRDLPPLREESPLSEAARGLGAKLDHVLMLLTRLPWPVWTALGVAVLAGTYPRSGGKRALAGIVVDDRLSIWLSRLVVIALFSVVASLCFFVIRTLLRYMEQDRWPRRAGVVEMDELVRAQDQLARNADDLSSAADTARMLTKTLADARDTILLLHGELERVRPTARGEASGESSKIQRQ